MTVFAPSVMISKTEIIMLIFIPTLFTLGLPFLATLFFTFMTFPPCLYMIIVVFPTIIYIGYFIKINNSNFEFL